MFYNFLEFQILEEGVFKNLNLEIFLLISLTATLCRTLVLQNNSTLNFPLLVEQTYMTVTLIVCLSVILLYESNFNTAGLILFNGSLKIDTFGLYLRFLLFLTLLLFLISSKGILNEHFLSINEIFALILLSTIGLSTLVNVTNLLYLFLTLEIQSLAFYVLAAIKRDSDFSMEAGIKYYVLGAVASSFLLFGISLIYGFTGTLNYFEIREVLSSCEWHYVTKHSVCFMVSTGFIYSALLFKIGIAPFHFWVADVYEGSPSMTTAFFSLVPKICLLGALVRFCFEVSPFIHYLWQPIFMFCGALSVIIGTFGAIAQKRIKRLLAYSAIGHAGFLLLAFSSNQYLSIDALLIYGILYILTTGALFIFILNNRNRFSIIENPTLFEVSSFVRTNSLLGGSLAIPFFSLAGIPPLAGFVSKFQMFSVVLESGYFITAISLITVSVVACFYYIRFVKISFFEILKTSGWNWSLPLNKGAAIMLGICNSGLLLFTLVPGFLTSTTFLI